MRVFTPLILIFFLTGSLLAQTVALAPIDPATRTGTLDNGMRYFILKNAKPENRIEMRLIVQAGSLQETPQEAGLAHLLEHMQFEGTEHFGPQAIVNFLESNGMRFGGDLNAFTNYTDTQYFLNLPADNPGAMGTGLAILEDWAHGPKIASDLLEKEKHIVAEEDRLRNQSVQGRSQLFIMNTIFADSPWDNHLPIGDMKIVQAATPSSLRHFVDSWYVPQAMSLVIVGSLDPDAMEQQLRASFKSRFTKALSHPAPAIPGLPLLTRDSNHFFKDTQLSNNLYLMWKIADIDNSSIEARERQDFISTVTLDAIQKRLADLARQPDSGLVWAGLQIQRIMDNKAEFDFVIVPREGAEQQALTTYIAEMRKAANFGLTESEFELGRKAWLDANIATVTQKDNLTNNQKASWLASWIINGAPFPILDDRFEFRKNLATQITRTQINAAIANYIIPQPATLIVQTIDKPGAIVPSAETLNRIKAAALATVVSANAERIQIPLVAKAPRKGSISKSEAVPGTPYTRWTLSNGLQLYLYRNTLTKNDFQLRAYAMGGLSTLKDADYQNANYAAYLLGQNGAGSLNQSQLQDFLNGKKANVHLSLDESEAVISGSSDPADPDDMLKFFQLLYIKMTSVRRDSAAEQTALANLGEWLRNNQNQAESLYQAAELDLLTNHAPRLKRFTAERLPELRLDRAAELQQSFFASGLPFTFVISGDFQEAELRDLVETWLASIPVKQSLAKSAKDLGIRPSRGPITKLIEAGLDKKAVITLFMETKYPYSAANWQVSTVLQEAMNIRLREVLRQEKEGTYDVSCSLDLSPLPYPHMQVWVNFTCALEHQTELIKALNDELRAISQGNISDDVFNKALEIRKRSIESGEKTNAYWMDNLFWSLIHKDNLQAATQWPAFYDSIKKSAVLAMAAQTIKPQSALTFILNPEKAH